MFCPIFGGGFSKKCALRQRLKCLIISIGLSGEPPIRDHAETDQSPRRDRESGFGCKVLRTFWLLADFTMQSPLSVLIAFGWHTFY